MSEETIIEFLRNPIEAGAYHTHIIITKQQIRSLWKYLKSYSKKKRKRFKIEDPFIGVEDLFYLDFPFNLSESMDHMLNFLYGREDLCPEQVFEWADYGTVVMQPEYDLEEEEEYYFFPPKIYFMDISDAMSIEVNARAYPDFVMDVVTLTPKALSIFKSFLNSIPTFENKIKMTNESKRHSGKYVYQLYPAVAALWVDCFSHYQLSEDIIDLLKASLDYFYQREWRTSIVLSAISVEAVLAEIYEEVFHQEAPPIPLGELKLKIIDKKDLPKEATRPLKTLNDMRRAAVHRGYTALTVKEATHALRF